MNKWAIVVLSLVVLFWSLDIAFSRAVELQDEQEIREYVSAQWAEMNKNNHVVAAWKDMVMTVDNQFFKIYPDGRVVKVNG